MWVYPGLRRANTTKVVGIYLANKRMGGGRTIVSSPDPPSTLQEERGGLVNIVQHFCISAQNFSGRW